MRFISRIFVLCLFSLPVAAYAHGDEDHGAKAPVLTQSVAPRAFAVTDDFELVAVLEAKKFLIYLDRFATNEPVLKAKLEVEGAGVKAYASETSPGVYVLDMPLLAAGKYPLTITLEAGEISDLLSLSLEVVAPANNVSDHSGWATKLTGTAGTAWLSASVLLLLLAGAGVLLARRRKKIQGR
jgi:LPXTG-motif cell wall-anchored protein